MSNSIKKIAQASFMIFLLFSLSCSTSSNSTSNTSSGGGGGAPANPGPGNGGAPVVSGQVFDGPVQGSTINAYPVSSTGVVAANPVASTITLSG